MFNEFSIESACAPEAMRKKVVLEGMNNVSRILKSSSRSTEEFITGAISDLGTADRNIMYVNSSLNALSDRLHTAGKLAMAINTSKDRGVEGFQSVEYLNPWKYAIEGKVGAWFAKVWEAIKTACRRVLSAIVNFIKWLSNQIQSVGVKAQVKDYEYYKKNQGMLKTHINANKDTPFNSIDWVAAGDVGKTMQKFAGEYNRATKSARGDYDLIEKLSNSDLRLMTSTKAMNAGVGASGTKGIVNKVGAAFGSDKSKYAGIRAQIAKCQEEIDKELASITSSVFGRAQEGKKNAHGMVYGALSKSGDKVIKMTIGEMAKRSDNFAILTEEWLAKNVKENVATCNEAMKEFTSYTKAIDKLAAQFDKAMGGGETGFEGLSQMTSKLANSRIRYNSFMQSLMLEMESAAFRYRRSAHTALKLLIRAGSSAKKAAKKEAEAKEMYQQSVEQLFNFD